MANFFGNPGANVIAGAGFIDNIFGFAGPDTLFGGGNEDVLYGGVGNDNLIGGGGEDVLVGGAGFDVFNYDTVLHSQVGAGARDIIVDFDGNGAAAGDRIDLSTIDADVSPGMGGDQDFTSAQLSYSANGILSVDVIGNPGAVDLQIALVGAPFLDIVGATNDIIL